MLGMRAAGKSAREIAEAAGISHTAVLKRLKRADREAAGPQTAESLKQAIIADIDPEKLTVTQKLSALRTLSKSRKRGVRGDLDAECERYVATVAGRTFTKGASPITEEAARRFFAVVNPAFRRRADPYGL